MKRQKKALTIRKFKVANLSLTHIYGGQETGGGNQQDITQFCNTNDTATNEYCTCTQTVPKTQPRNPCGSDDLMNTILTGQTYDTSTNDDTSLVL
ncbi:MAG: hypothetical protein AAF617_04330 [Bacteroidota bacterium]